jgi:hypothetical protein
MVKKKTKKKAIKAIEKAVRKAVHKGIGGEVVQQAVENAMEVAVEHKAPATKKDKKQAQAGETLKKKSKTAKGQDESGN